MSCSGFLDDFLAIFFYVWYISMLSLIQGEVECNIQLVYGLLYCMCQSLIKNCMPDIFYICLYSFAFSSCYCGSSISSVLRKNRSISCPASPFFVLVFYVNLDQVTSVYSCCVS